MYDVLYAFAVVVGVSIASTLAFVAAGVMHRRSQVSAAKLGSGSTTPPLQSTRDDARELVLR